MRGKIEGVCGVKVTCSGKIVDSTHFRFTAPSTYLTEAIWQQCILVSISSSCTSKSYSISMPTIPESSYQALQPSGPSTPSSSKAPGLSRHISHALACNDCQRRKRKVSYCDSEVLNVVRSQATGLRQLHQAREELLVRYQDYRQNASKVSFARVLPLYELTA